jgi:hypothetical protein
MPEKGPFDKKDATESVSESENPAIPSPTLSRGQNGEEGRESGRAENGGSVN